MGKGTSKRGLVGHCYDISALHTVKWLPTSQGSARNIILAEYNRYRGVGSHYKVAGAYQAVFPSPLAQADAIYEYSVYGVIVRLDKILISVEDILKIFTKGYKHCVL